MYDESLLQGLFILFHRKSAAEEILSLSVQFNCLRIRYDFAVEKQPVVVPVMSQLKPLVSAGKGECGCKVLVFHNCPIGIRKKSPKKQLRNLDYVKSNIKNW